MRTDRASGSIATGLITALVLLFLFVPLIIVVLFSFHESASLSFPFEGFSTRWYDEVFASETFTGAITSSLILAATTAGVTFVLGTLAAYGVTRSPSQLRGPLTLLFFLPITLPPLFIGIALLSAFSRVEITPSLFTIAVAHSIFAFPFFFLVARLALDRLDPMLEETAADLGAGPARRFVKVTMPQVLPVLIGAAALAFMISLDEFVITFFVAGSETTLPLFIFSRLRQTLDPSINVVSTLLMGVTLLLWVAALLVTARNERRRASGRALLG